MSKLTFYGVLILILSVYSANAVAKTPDGTTPAEETVCDPLRVEGITKGLYGLCVAFCEARDVTSENIPITEEDYERLIDSMPSDRILENYNKKKSENDPPMPCVKIEEPDNGCPCFSNEELASIDGVSCQIPLAQFSCINFENPIGSFINTYVYQVNKTNDGHEYMIIAQYVSNGVQSQCWYALQETIDGVITQRENRIMTVYDDTCQQKLLDNIEANSTYCNR